MTEISFTAFVDTFFGNDQTAQLNSLTFPFQRFDVAYQAIVDARQDQDQPYTISLSSGLYLLGLVEYDNIVISSTNSIDGLSPLVVLNTTENEILWNGVSFNGMALFILQNPDSPLNFSLRITGGSEISATSVLFIENEDILSIREIKNHSPLTKEKYLLYLDYVHHKKKCRGNQKRSTIVNKKKNKKKHTREITSTISPLIINESQFDLRALTIIDQIDFQGNEIINFIDSRNGDLICLPPNIYSDHIVVVQVEGSKTCLFVESIYSSVETTQDLIYGLIGPRESNKSSIIFSGVNINVSSFSSEVQNLFRMLDTSKITTHKEITSTNQIASRIKDNVETQISNNQSSVKNRLTNDEVLPIVALLNSILTGSSGNFQLIDNIDYLIDRGNLSGIYLFENDGINTYPILNLNQKEGSEVNRGSKFIRYRTLDQKRYIHRLYDGEIFLINAETHDVVIEIPPSGSGNLSNSLWRGRILTYKRIDRSDFCVKIINQRGTIDKGKKCDTNFICLNSDCKRKILPSVSLLLTEEGNAFILG